MNIRTMSRRIVDGARDVSLRVPPRPRPLTASPPNGLKAVPGERGLPLAGHLLGGLLDAPALQMQLYRRHGAVSWTHAFGMRAIMVAGAEATHAVMLNKDQSFANDLGRFFEPFFHRGLLLLDFDEHFAHRRLMNVAFTRERLARYTEIVTTVSADEVTKWPAGEQLLAYSAVKQLSLDLIAEIFMTGSLGAERTRLLDAMLDCTDGRLAAIRLPIPGGKYRAGVRGRQALQQYYRNAIAERRSRPRDDFLSTMISAGFDDDDIVNHMIFLIMAGHDTTATTAATAVYHLGKNPEWQQRAREESLARGDAALDLAGLEKLTTLDLVVKEALRLTAPVPSLMRKSVKDTEIAGYFIPKDHLIMVCDGVNHHLEEFWTDPAIFDPSRFAAPRREDNSHRMAWIPFGAGVHKCIGINLGTIQLVGMLDALVRRFSWTLPQDYEIPWGQPSLPYPVDGLPVTFRPV